MRTPPEELQDRLGSEAERILTDRDLRLEDVARLVGTSRARLYYYFSGQADLHAYLVGRHLQEGARVVADAADPGLAPPARLRAVVVAAVEYLAERPGVCAGMLGGAGGGSLQEVLGASDDLIGAAVRAVLAEGTADGSLRAPDPAVATDAILGALLLAVLGRWRRGAEGGVPELARAVADQVLDGVTS